MSKKALVTGAAGFIGRHVVAALLESGWEVVGLDIGPRPSALECDWHQCSILEAGKVSTAMHGCDTVFHLAAHAHLFAQDVKIYDQINHIGTKAIITAALQKNVEHLVATLSATALTPFGHKAVVSPYAPRPAIQNLAGPYARSKWRADRALAQIDTVHMMVTRLFPTVPVGAGDYGFTAPTQMLNMFFTQPPPAYFDAHLNLVCVKAIAKAHAIAAETVVPDKHNAKRQYILAGETWTLSAVLEYIESKTGIQMPKRTIPYFIAKVAANVAEPYARLTGGECLATKEGVRLARANPSFDTSSAKQDIGWQPASPAAAINDSLTWLEIAGQR